MYGAAHALVANGFADEIIDRWITHYLERPPQPREIADTVSKVRAEVEGLIEPKARVSLKREFDEEKLKALTAEGPLPVEDFLQSSPIAVADITASEFLRRLYPKQANIIFTDQQSQGKLVWNETMPDLLVDNAITKNTEGAWIMVNPVNGKFLPIPRLGKKSQRAEENLVAYEYLLIESDSVEMELWLRVLSKLDLPIVAVTTSGSKSAHALVRVGQKDREGYLARASEIADLVVPLGADPAAMSAVRLTRVPGCMRRDTGKAQTLIYFNPDAGKVAGDSAERSQEDINEESDATNCQDSTDSIKPSTSAEKSGQYDDIYYDGKTFFMRAGDGIWRYEMVAMLSSELKCRNISDRAPKGAAMSKMDEAKAFIRKHRRVDGAGPSLYNPNELWFEGGKKYLNTAKNVKIMPAAETAGDWGVGFPRYAAILDNVFAHLDYRDFFMAWLKRFYESAEKGKLCMGQAMILVGPVHCYKTFFIERLLKPAMGGYADLSSIVSGEGNGFNADLFQSPLAIIDDTKAAESEAQTNRYSSAIKKLVAHGTHKYHEKYLTPIMVEWRGRVVIAANDDPVSIKAVPALDMSNKDKIIALALKTFEEGPTVDDLKDVEIELPAFLAWLKAWDIPAKYIDAANRYYVMSYISPEVMEKIAAASPSAELRDTINAWWDRRDGNEWEGTAVELHQSFNDTFDNASLTRQWTVRSIGRRLGELQSQGDPNVELVAKRSGKAKLYKYRLTRPKIESEPEPEPEAF
jgi:hypothetical protein